MQYWKSLEELNTSPSLEAQRREEFAEPVPLDAFLEDTGLKKVTPRRDFLKTLGFGLGAVTLAACNKAPLHRSIPYLIKPEEITPGIPNYYTSNFEGYSILVKTREGRPIKIEGNPNCPIGKGAVDALGQASVLGLYDSEKLKGPVLNNSDATWDEVDGFVLPLLKEFKINNKNIAVLADSITSPSMLAALDDFKRVYPTAQVVTYDPVSYSSIIQANKNSFDKALIPSYHFDRADVIVSFGADFLGTWLSPLEFTRQYASTKSASRLLEKRMSRHIQFETNLSLTGSNADFRYAIRPSQEGIAMIALYNVLAKYAGKHTMGSSQTPKVKAGSIEKTASDLWAARGKSLVVSGSNDISIQILCNAINALLGNYGTTIDVDHPSFYKSGNDALMMQLVSDMNAGKIDALIVAGSNPVYDYSKSESFLSGLKKVKLKISLASRLDETARWCNVVAPDQHYLESWGDTQVKNDVYAIRQPTISPVFDSRAALQTFIKWAGVSGQAKPVTAPSEKDSASNVAATVPVTATAATGGVTEYVEYIKNFCEKNIFPQAAEVERQTGFVAFWENLLRAGMVSLKAGVAPTMATPSEGFTVSGNAFDKDLASVVQRIEQNSSEAAGNFEISLYQSVALRDGKLANNPWLQELPDPVSKITWDNYMTISPKTAKDLGFIDGDLVTVKGPSNNTLNIHLVVQAGQANGTGSMAVGYGRTASGKAGDNVGTNVYPLVNFVNGSFHYNAKADIVKIGRGYEFARTQTHDMIEGRDMLRETILSEYIKNPFAGSGKGEKEEEKPNVWDEYAKKGHHWGMSIDQNTCTGCGACVVACVAENNIAVVGKSEVHKRREMHWIRIDRYYAINTDEGKGLNRDKDVHDLAKEGKLDEMEQVSVFYQPMLCQQCNHAPCETVCPVLATMHSSEGLSQQVYNRCFGTRYCANNCPYKVRRFNWFKYFDNDQFDYHMNDNLGKMVLNPDVTVRSRGVMEKCSFCVQRIQAGKLEAKIEGRPLADGEIKTACQQTCPTNAIVFGDINDPNSEVSKLLKNERTYYVLEELGIEPGIGYLTKVRNRDRTYEPSKPFSI